MNSVDSEFLNQIITFKLLFFLIAIISIQLEQCLYLFSKLNHCINFIVVIDQVKI